MPDCIWLALNIADCSLTVWIIIKGGIEVMPIAAWLIGYSIWLFIAVKIGLAVLAVYWLRRHPATYPVLNGSMAAIVAFNAFSATF